MKGQKECLDDARFDLIFVKSQNVTLKNELPCETYLFEPGKVTEFGATTDAVCRIVDLS
jgi:hypothetical protein